jgi:hypothetical protein
VIKKMDLMIKNTITFPDLIELGDYGGDYDSYEEALLAVYEADLWKGGITFNGLNVIPRVHKRFMVGEKTLDWTFAHFTSRGSVDADRELDLRRCERLGWVKPIIMNAHLDCVKVWENDRYNQNGQAIRSVVLWCQIANSKIVLTKVHGKKNDYYVVTTFYLVNDSKRVKNLNDEYDNYVRDNGIYAVAVA